MGEWRWLVAGVFLSAGSVWGQFVVGPASPKVEAKVVPASAREVTVGKWLIRSSRKRDRLRALSIFGRSADPELVPLVLWQIRLGDLAIQRKAVQAYWSISSNCDDEINRVEGKIGRIAVGKRKEALRARFDRFDAPSGIVDDETFRRVMHAGLDLASGRRVLHSIAPQGYFIYRPQPDSPGGPKLPEEDEGFVCGTGSEFAAAYSTIARRWPDAVAEELEKPNSAMAERLLVEIDQVRTPRLRKAILRWACGNSFAERAAACQALGKTHGDAVDAVLRERTRDAYPQVRLAAVNALAEGHPGQAWSIRASALFDPSKRVRSGLLFWMVMDLPRAEKLLGDLRNSTKPYAIDAVSSLAPAVEFMKRIRAHPID